jgi:hypothetical protein
VSDADQARLRAARQAAALEREAAGLARARARAVRAQAAASRLDKGVRDITARGADAPTDEARLRGLRSAIAEVARDHASAKNTTIIQALIWAMEQRGFYDFVPDKEMVERIRTHGG